VSGRQSTFETNQLLTRAIVFLTKSQPRNLVPISDSPWVIVEMKNKVDVKTLLAQKLILYLGRSPLKQLIVFRRIVTHSTCERIVEVKGIRHAAEFAEVKARLTAESIVVSFEDPSSDTWTPAYSDRVVWQLIVPSSTFVLATSVSLNRGSVRLVPAPNCDFCHSDNHHRSRCPWTAILNLS